MDVCSLFCGIGGIDLGFKQTGFDIVQANEFDAAACKTALGFCRLRSREHECFGATARSGRQNQERTVSCHLDQKRPNRKRLGLFLTLFHQSNIKFYGAVCGFKANSLVMTVNCFTFFTSQIHCRKTVNLITNNTPMT